MTAFPISQKLLRFWKTRNLAYLITAAIATRLVIAMARIVQNRPHKLEGLGYTPEERSKSFQERIFIEGFGTVSYVGLMHVAQDLVAMALGKSEKHHDDYLKKSLIKQGVGSIEADKILKVWSDSLGKSPSERITSVIFNNRDLNPFNQQLTKNNISAEVIEKATKPLQTAFKTLKKHANVTMLAGVLTGAIYGGWIIQWLNDHWFSPSFTPFVNFLISRFKKRDNKEESMDSLIQTPAVSSLLAAPESTSFQEPGSIIQPIREAYTRAGYQSRQNVPLFPGYQTVLPFIARH